MVRTGAAMGGLQGSSSSFCFEAGFGRGPGTEVRRIKDREEEHAEKVILDPAVENIDLSCMT